MSSANLGPDMSPNGQPDNPSAIGQQVMSSPLGMRLGLLALVLAAGVGSVARIVTQGATFTAARPDQPIALPEQVAIPAWQQTQTQELPTKLPPEPGQTSVENATSEIKAAREYRYQKGNMPLRVEARQMLSDGNVSRYLFVYKKEEIGVANSKLQVRYKPGLGNYGVLVHNDQAYLTACVNPRGETTANEAQFQQNLLSGVGPARLVGAALGMGSVGDYRCLWTFMSMPLTPPGSGAKLPNEAVFQQLEEIWVPWAEHWRSNFPAS
jgi:cyanosortase A-associated protein